MMPTPTRGDGLIRSGLALSLVGLLGLAGVYLMALYFTPVERWQGLAQKIFYIHAPAAMAAQLAFVVVGLASAGYLGLRDPRLDRLAESSAEVGLAFSAVMLTTGPIWARPIWGTWWQWEPRLTLTLLLVFLFLGYRALRTAVVDPAERARYAAVVGIFALVLVPFIHLSVYLFRTIHPQPIVLKPGRPSLPGDMLRTFLTSMVVFTVLYLGFVITRYGIALRRENEGGQHG